MDTRRKPKTDKTCLCCSSIFSTAYNNKIYCSKSCNSKMNYKHKQKKRDYYKYDRNYALVRNYGITLEQYTQRLTEQNHLCAICKQPETKRSSRTGNLFYLAVDHCHTTGKIRGLLCKRCNMILGSVEDKESILESAIRYLKELKNE